MGLLEYRDFGISGEDDDICIDLQEGWQIPPSVRRRDWTVPRQDGRTEGNTRLDIITLPLAGTVKGSGATPEERLADFNDNCAAMLAVLTPGLPSGELRLSDGYLGIDTGEVVSIDARVKNASPGRIESYRTSPIQRWSFELECLIPEWTVGT